MVLVSSCLLCLGHHLPPWCLPTSGPHCSLLRACHLLSCKFLQEANPCYLCPLRHVQQKNDGQWSTSTSHQKNSFPASTLQSPLPARLAIFFHCHATAILPHHHWVLQNSKASAHLPLHRRSSRALWLQPLLLPLSQERTRQFMQFSSRRVQAHGPIASTHPATKAHHLPLLEP